MVARKRHNVTLYVQRALAVLSVFMLTDEFCVKFCKMLVLYQIIYSRKFLNNRGIAIRFPITDRHISRSFSSRGRQGLPETT